MNNNKAITLIALVITIVVLIILAAVAINLSLGNNGIFNRAKTAKEQYQNAQDYEQIEVAKTSNKIDEYVGNGREATYIKSITDEISMVQYTNQSYSSANILTYYCEEAKQIKLKFTYIQSGTLEIIGIKSDNSEEQLKTWTAGNNTNIVAANTPEELIVNNSNKAYIKVKVKWQRPTNYVNSSVSGTIERIFN